MDKKKGDSSILENNIYIVEVMSKDQIKELNKILIGLFGEQVLPECLHAEHPMTFPKFIRIGSYVDDKKWDYGNDYGNIGHSNGSEVYLKILNDFNSKKNMILTSFPKFVDWYYKNKIVVVSLSEIATWKNVSKEQIRIIND